MNIDADTAVFLDTLKSALFAAVVLRAGIIKTGDALVIAADEIIAIWDRVSGNRSETAMMGIADKALLAESVFRRCVEIIEERTGGAS